jgi:crotonobetainyl-CoA:carnitine CoA-transferase CaiB-like acyl-CoA transferase
MARGVPAGPVHSVPQAFSQAHARHRKMLVDDGEYRGIGLPIKLSGTPGAPGTRPPRLNEHSELIDAS